MRHADDERSMLVLAITESDDGTVLRELPASMEMYARDEGPGLLALGEIDGIQSGGSAARHVNQLFSGGVFGAAGGPFLFHVALWTPADYRTEFLAWYEIEHLPMLLEAPTWDGCRFVEEAVDEGFLFHALHQLSDRAALDSDQRRRSRTTPWFQRLARNQWFDSGFKRALYRRT